MRWMTLQGKVVHGFLGKNELIREHGVIEQICGHGCGHPIGHVVKWEPSWMGTHGCCGCCDTAKFALVSTVRIMEDDGQTIEVRDAEAAGREGEGRADSSSR